MTLHETLLKASSEEDVKAAYIKALGLKDIRRNLIDIQTKEVWFEAKLGARHSTYYMFTQLLNYVWVALKEGEPVPPFLCVVDSVKAALMKTEVALPLLKGGRVSSRAAAAGDSRPPPVKWGRSASDVTPEALDAVSQFIGTHFVSFRIETQEREFIDTVKAAIRSGEIIRTQITPDNLKQVFDRWVEMVGREIAGVGTEDYALLFYADVMSDGTVSTHENLPAELLHKNGRPAFLLNGTLYNLGSTDGYRRFWAIYDRPPKEEYRNYLLKRRDQRGTKWSDGAIGYMCTSADVQHVNYVFLLSSAASMGHGIFITSDNLERAAVWFAVARIIKPTWLNDRDQFLIPDKELSGEFKLDCLVYMLFHNSNLTASADGLEWNGRKWSIVNHFIPFTEEEVNAPDRFESDFMVRYLETHDGKPGTDMRRETIDASHVSRLTSQPSQPSQMSHESQAVLTAGREIWCAYFERFSSFDYSIREKFKLNRPDAGWYQIRQALKAYGESEEGRPTDFTRFESAYRALADKLRPKVYEYGFLKT